MQCEFSMRVRRQIFILRKTLIQNSKIIQHSKNMPMRENSGALTFAISPDLKIVLLIWFFKRHSGKHDPPGPSLNKSDHANSPVDSSVNSSADSLFSIRFHCLIASLPHLFK
jgi:hypothetical protein